MYLKRAKDLVSLLRSPRARCRVGILLLAPEDCGKEHDLAARLGVGTADYLALLIESLPTGARFADITAAREEARLNELAMKASEHDCTLVYNLDVALARLSSPERAELWANLYSRFPHRPNALILGVPASGKGLLPTGEALTAWVNESRVVEVEVQPDQEEGGSGA